MTDREWQFTKKVLSSVQVLLFYMLLIIFFELGLYSFSVNDIDSHKFYHKTKQLEFLALRPACKTCAHLYCQSAQSQKLQL